MATYTELHDLVTAGGLNALRVKMRIAIAVKANAIAKDVNATAAAKDWARQALQRPAAFEEQLIYYILAEFNTATPAAISGAADAQVQTAVDAAVSTLLGA